MSTYFFALKGINMFAYFLALMAITISINSSATMTEQQAIILAKQILSQNLHIKESLLEVGQVRAVQWSDTSLGCPEPGMMYAQVITPGYEVLLTVDEKHYSVHVGEGRAVVCDHSANEEDSLPQHGHKSSEKLRLINLARGDLAVHLNIDPALIKLDTIKTKTWSDTSLGCPMPDMVYAQMVTQGYQIELEYNGHRYSYHTDKQKVVLCEKNR